VLQAQIRSALHVRPIFNKPKPTFDGIDDLDVVAVPHPDHR
jgi:hypothetical protein